MVDDFFTFHGQFSSSVKMGFVQSCPFSIAQCGAQIIHLLTLLNILR
ncbi:hypothetical protein HMPREF1148_2181 [Selenomonas sp. FOBRC6]|nr:hypothetical protein HMPREF1148_2181 [Selenomonas sp. FOBRC6]